MVLQQPYPLQSKSCVATVMLHIRAAHHRRPRNASDVDAPSLEDYPDRQVWEPISSANPVEPVAFFRQGNPRHAHRLPIS